MVAWHAGTRYIDETHKDTKTARRHRGWGLRGGPAPRSYEVFDDKSMTIIAACNIDGFIPTACRFYTHQGSGNREKGGPGDTVTQTVRCLACVEGHPMRARLVRRRPRTQHPQRDCRFAVLLL